MLYDLYFHDDFDGRASAAVMLSFLLSRGDGIQNYYPVGHDVQLKERWPKLKFARPAIIVDFRYHPRAAFFFDHHATTFMKESWRRNFRPTKFHHLNIKYLSCCRVVLDALVKDFGFKPKKYLKDLAKWLDVIDGAKYTSAAQAVAMKEPALQIDAYIDWCSKGKSLAWLIRLLSEQPLAAVAADPRIRKAAARLRKRQKGILEMYRKHTKIYGRIAFLDFTNATKGGLRFASYYLFPRITYNLFLKRSGGMFHISLGKNPWKRGAGKIHLGKLLAKWYNGGGHKNAGGARFRTRREAEKAVAEIIDYLK